MTESKGKAKGKSRASKSGKSATKSKPKAGNKAKSGAGKATPSKRPAGHEQATGEAASRLIDQRIRDLGGWRGETLARMRALILEADPEMTEEWKWMGTPVWSHQGIICTGESYTMVVKLTFARGASIPDPARLFNSSLEGNTRRAIDIHEGEKVDPSAFKALIKAAVAQNGSPGNKGQAKCESGQADQGARKGENVAVVLLPGGNPKIAKADGHAPVQAYIATMPGWKRNLGKLLDALIVRKVPNVCKAVKWNSPFYGIEGQGWFLSFHVFTHYVKVSFFRGTSLRPVPPGGTGKDARWIDIREADHLDETQMATWVKQAAALPGWLA